MGALGNLKRRRYADGGDVDNPFDDATMMDTSGLQGYDRSPDVTSGAPVGQGAMSTGPRNSDQVGQDIDRGTRALARQVAQQQATNQVLSSAGIRTPPVLSGPSVPSFGQSESFGQPLSSIDAPALAAAGAMLKPTHSGGFAEALGNAFTAAEPAIQQQRQLEESAALRKAQLDNNAAIWGSRIGVQQQNADTAAARQAASAQYLQSKARYQAEGLGEKTSHDRAMEDAQNVLLGIRQQNADTSTTRANTTADQGNRRLDIQSQAEQRRQQQFQASQEWRQTQADLRAKGINEADIRTIQNNALGYVNGGMMSAAKALELATANHARAAAAINANPVTASRLTGTSRPPASSGGGPLPLPGSQADLQDGKPYQTARGVATWDAGSKQFIPVGQ